MAEGDQFPSAFRGLDGGNPSHGQKVAFGGFSALDQRQGAGFHADAALGNRFPFGGRTIAHLHHVHFTLLIEMAEGITHPLIEEIVALSLPDQSRVTWPDWMSK